jgi:hypothetical protein
MAKTRDKMYLSSEGPGNDITPFQLYSAKIDDPKMELSKKTFKMSEPVHSHYYPRAAIGYDTTRTYTPDISSKKTSVETKSSEKPKPHYTAHGYGYYDDDLPVGYDPRETLSSEDRQEYVAIMETIDMFFDEIDVYKTTPDIEWYITQIREEMQAASNKFEKEMTQGMAVESEKEAEQQTLALPATTVVNYPDNHF